MAIKLDGPRTESGLLLNVYGPNILYRSGVYYWRRDECVTPHDVAEMLAMDEYIDFFRGNIKQPDRLDNFQRLVHHRRRVYRNLWPHRPCRVREGIFNCSVLYLVGSGGPERASGTGQNNLFYFFMISGLKRLKYGTVFAINRQNSRAVLFCRLGKEFACNHQRLFVGDGNGFSF